MLTLLGNSSNRWCDKRSRRDFLKIGSLAVGGLSLPEMLRAGDQAGTDLSHKSVSWFTWPADLRTWIWST